MTRETSCGAVVFTRLGDEIRYVLAQSLEGRWGFPKGHMEPGETPSQTALREIEEETGLRVTLLDGFRAEDEYPLPGREDVIKRVVFFLAAYEGQEPRPQETELRSVALLPYKEALARLSFESTRRVLTEAHAFLTGICPEP